MDARNPTTHVRALREAALRLGGDQKLAKFLDIEEWLVSRWLEGLGHPPDFIFSRCEDQIECGKQVVPAAAPAQLHGAPREVDGPGRCRADSASVLPAKGC